MSAKEHN